MTRRLSAYLLHKNNKKILKNSHSQLEVQEEITQLNFYIDFNLWFETNGSI